MAFLDVCRFTATSSGTGDFVVSAAVTGYQTPASASAVNATVYRYRAESADLSQWEIGYGAYTTGSVTLARTTIVASSTGSKVSFSAAPQVAVVALSQDMLIPAVQADQETATSNTTIVTPGVQKYHPSAAKAWALISPTGTLLAGYNIASTSRTSAGLFNWTYTTNFSSANYAAASTSLATSTGYFSNVTTISTSGGTVTTFNIAGTLQDPNTGVSITCYGDQ